MIHLWEIDWIYELKTQGHSSLHWGVKNVVRVLKLYCTLWQK